MWIDQEWSLLHGEYGLKGLNIGISEKRTKKLTLFLPPREKMTWVAAGVSLLSTKAPIWRSFDLTVFADSVQH